MIARSAPRARAARVGFLRSTTPPATRIHRSWPLVVASSLLLGAFPFVTVAGAHPHVPGDPFADVGDTIVAGSPRLAPIRGASHQRWTVTDVRGGGRMPAGTLDQRVSRADTPAGRQWCVAIESRDAAGKVTVRDSIWVSAGSPIPVYESRVTDVDTVALSFDASHVRVMLAGNPERSGLHAMPVAAFPRELSHLLVGQIRIAPGASVALALFTVGNQEGFKGMPLDLMMAIQSAGVTVLDHRGRSRRCDMLAGTETDADGGCTFWIDRSTHAILRQEIRNASGELLRILEAE